MNSTLKSTETIEKRAENQTHHWITFEGQNCFPWAQKKT